MIAPLPFKEGDTVKSLVRNRRFLNEKGFIIAIKEVQFIAVRFCGTKLISKLFSNYELVRTRIILIEKYEM